MLTIALTIIALVVTAWRFYRHHVLTAPREEDLWRNR